MKISGPSRIGGKEIIVFDIGGASIGVGVIEVHSKKPSTVRAAKRFFIPYQDRAPDQAASGLVQQIQEQIQGFFDALVKTQGLRAKEVHIVFHTPWATTQTFTAAAPLKGEMKVVPDMLTQISNRALEGKESAADPFERVITRVELNGYPTENPVGKAARHMRVVLLESTLAADIASSVGNVVGTIIPGREQHMYSSTFVDTHVLRIDKPNTAHYTIADVTAQTTALTIVRDGDVIGHTTVPIGSRTLIQRVKGEKETPEADIASRIGMLLAGTCEDTDCDVLEQALEAAVEKCMSSFGKAFETLANEHHLPNTLVLRVNTNVVGWFSNFFGRVDFAQFTETRTPFRVLQLMPSSLSDYVVFAPNVEHDAGVASIAAFVHTQDSSQLDSIPA